MTRPLGVLAAALALAACTGEPPGEQLTRAGDVATYARDVHPYLEASCATLDCHGDRGRPLRLYAETGLRADAALRGQPITEAELRANVAALIGIDPSAGPDDHLALRKPLSQGEGGIAHVGPKLWRNRDDPGYRCLRAWLSGGSDPAACAAALAPVALPPP